jgi:hypothetical protein
VRRARVGRTDHEQPVDGAQRKPPKRPAAHAIEVHLDRDAVDGDRDPGR